MVPKRFTHINFPFKARDKMLPNKSCSIFTSIILFLLFKLKLVPSLAKLCIFCFFILSSSFFWLAFKSYKFLTTPVSNTSDMKNKWNASLLAALPVPMLNKVSLFVNNENGLFLWWQKSVSPNTFRIFFILFGCKSLGTKFSSSVRCDIVLNMI